MRKSKKEKKIQLTINDDQLPVKTKKLTSENIDEDSTVLPFSNSTSVLMPELEELVKKNPNRLIGCGG